MARFRAFAANRGVKVETKVAERLVAAAKTALPTGDAEVARQVLAADLELLAGLDTQIAQVDARIAALLPTTPFAVLTTTPGWERYARPRTPQRLVSPAGGRRHRRSIGLPG